MEQGQEKASGTLPYQGITSDYGKYEAFTASALQEVYERFLESFTDASGSLKYRIAVSQMPALAATSLSIDYEDLIQFDPELSVLVVKEPRDHLRCLRAAALKFLAIYNPEYAEKIRGRLEVRIQGLLDPISLRSIGQDCLNTLISIPGIITKSSEVLPLPIVSAFRCRADHLTFLSQPDDPFQKPRKCREEPCKCKEFWFDKENSKFTDCQFAQIQELPEELPPGQLPKSLEVQLVGDLINRTRPGDRVKITGILRIQAPTSGPGAKSARPSYYLESNQIERIGRSIYEQAKALTREDISELRSLVQHPLAYERIVQSVAPSIFGHELEKEAALLSVVGAPIVTLAGGGTKRGDINVLLCGDPGLAKTEILKFAQRISPRGIYTSGKGSSAAGLTAAIVKEKNGVMMLEGGVMVLADQGNAMIDELNLMNEWDRGALHEAMESNTVSIAKAGFVATLNARTSVLAAANPVSGKYDPFKNLLENIDLPVPLVNRFDLIFIVRDEFNEEDDRKVAQQIAETRKRSAPPSAQIDAELLKRLVIYAKSLAPELTDESNAVLIEEYLRLRKQTSGDAMQIPVNPRFLESMIRLSQARARILLHPRVTEMDARRAIMLVNHMLGTAVIDQATRKVDVGVLYNKPISELGLRETALQVFKKLSGEERVLVEDRAFYEEMEKAGKFTREQAEKAFQDMWKSGVIYEKKPHFFKKA